MIEKRKSLFLPYQALGFSKSDIVDEFYKKETLIYDKSLNKWKTKFDPENYKAKNFSEKCYAKNKVVVIREKKIFGQEAFK